MAKKVSVQPLGDRVLVRQLSKEEIEGKTASGIILPDTVDQEKSEQGEVVAVGPGKVGDDNERIPVAVSVGDRVVFSKYGFDEVTADGEEYLLIKEDSLLAVINQ
jgi:chaperonin GroES